MSMVANEIPGSLQYVTGFHRTYHPGCQRCGVEFQMTVFVGNIFERVTFDCHER